MIDLASLARLPLYARSVAHDAFKLAHMLGWWHSRSWAINDLPGKIILDQITTFERVWAQISLSCIQCLEFDSTAGLREILIFLGLLETNASAHTVRSLVLLNIVIFHSVAFWLHDSWALGHGCCFLWFEFVIGAMRHCLWVNRDGTHYICVCAISLDLISVSLKVLALGKLSLAHLLICRGA